MPSGMPCNRLYFLTEDGEYEEIGGDLDKKIELSEPTKEHCDYLPFYNKEEATMTVKMRKWDIFKLFYLPLIKNVFRRKK